MLWLILSDGGKYMFLMATTDNAVLSLFIAFTQNHAGEHGGCAGDFLWWWLEKVPSATTHRDTALSSRKSPLLQPKLAWGRKVKGQWLDFM